MVRSCQCGFGQQESGQDECRSKIRSHDSLRAPNDAVPPTSLDVGDGGQFSAVVTTGINAYRRANTTTTSLILREIAPISLGVWTAAKHLGPSAPRCRAP